VKLRCPACHAEASIEAYLGADAARGALVRALKMPAPLAPLLAQYLAMFRPEKRALSFERVDALLAELFVMIDSGQVSLNRNLRAAPLALWRQGLEHMVELRSRATEVPPRASLQLPLKTHGYLTTVVHGMAEKIAAAAESKHEAESRKGRRDEEPARPDNALALSGDRERIRSAYQLAIASRAKSMSDLSATGMPEEGAAKFLAEVEDVRNQLLEMRSGQKNDE
jgi:hypothetical protein